MDTTAKVRLTLKTQTDSGQTNLAFSADYLDDRNKEWAKYTPLINISMVVLDAVAERFEVGQSFILTFSPEDK